MQVHIFTLVRSKSLFLVSVFIICIAYLEQIQFVVYVESAGFTFIMITRGITAT